MIFFKKKKPHASFNLDKILTSKLNQKFIFTTVTKTQIEIFLNISYLFYTMGLILLGINFFDRVI